MRERKYNRVFENIKTLVRRYTSLNLQNALKSKNVSTLVQNYFQIMF